ncbi:putative Ig domain-containing protein [Pontiellaceae bacterium B12219]|nr:putative Ig domain-containing protein [Pontiellaceae bacterium B12219]
MNFKKYILRSVAAVVMTVSGEALAEPVVEATDRVQINETVTDGFIHPGIGLTKEILDTARAQVMAGRDPWLFGFNKLAAHQHSSRDVTCRNQKRKGSYEPDDDAFNSRSTLRRLQGDGDKAYRQALMYYFTGDLQYRANAMNIIRVWSQMDPDKYGSFNASHIHSGYAVKYLVMAAELMRYTESPDSALVWTDEDTDNLKKNIIDPGIRTFMYSNGWFMNQSGYPNAGAMACYIFLNDRRNYDKRVEWFTVNETAPNKGWVYSIRDLFRKEEVNAVTGERVEEPFVQLMEMGRDQAHAAGDMEIAVRTARLMNAQGTKVDPVRGTVSTAANAVGPYEFMNNRLLEGAEYVSRYMLGYDTPWIPSPSDIDSDGEVKQIYTRLSDNYRGRIRDLSYWDIYYYFTYKKGINVAEVAPYFDEAFKKRVVSDDFEWIFIPPEATGEAARIPQTEQEPDEVEIVERSTGFGNASVVEEDGNSFLRVKPAEAGARIALLSIKTPSKTIGLKMRTTGVVTLEMEGFEKPWLLPNTQGEWRYVTYTMSPFEYVEDIIFVRVKASPETRVDLDLFLRMPENQLTPPAFVSGNEPLYVNAYAGAAITLGFSATNAQQISSQGLPEGAELNAETGAFTWSPQEAGEISFVVEALNGKTVAPLRVTIAVAPDRKAAMEAIKSVHDADVIYVQGTLDTCIELYGKVARASEGTSDEVFWQGLLLLQQAFDNLEVLTPLLPDGSVDYPKIAVSSEIGNSIGLLIDSNDDTFPLSGLAKDMGYIFDFGPDFQMSFSAFAMEGRMNFEDRMEGTVFYGSNDQEKWVELTDSTELSTEMVKVDVFKTRREDRFRYLRIKKHGRGLFEPSELRIYGERHDAE